MWKDILGFEGYYQVNENGEILNVKTGKLRSLKPKKNGYVSVDLYKDGRAQWKRVHILVAQAFIPNPNNYPVVMHKDNNKSNNCVSNLKWGTISQNTKEAYEGGLFIHNKLLKYKVYNEEIGFSKEYIGAKAIVDELGIPKNMITYYSHNPDKKMIRPPFWGFQIEVVGRVADMERSTTIL